MAERKETTKNKKGGLKSSSQKIKAKILKSYYGNPTKDMKLVAITGTTGKTIVAHYVHEILRATGEQVAVLASDQPFKVGMLHKFLSDAWKAGANYVIVTVPAEGLRDNVFHGLPVHVAAMTNFVTAGLKDMEPEEYIENEKTLFDMNPEIVVLNADDLNYPTFEGFHGRTQTVTYGQTSSDVKILNSKLYPVFDAIPAIIIAILSLPMSVDASAKFPLTFAVKAVKKLPLYHVSITPKVPPFWSILCLSKSCVDPLYPIYALN